MAGGRAVVVLEYADLVADKDLSDQLLAAWGPGGLGVVAIRGVPEWQALYPAALKQAHQLAHLPASSLRALEHEPSMYNAGWSHGKEKLGDKPDFAKGSFYFNPLADEPGTAAERERFPWGFPCNLWPREELPELEGACKALGRAAHEVCAHLGRLVDRTVAGRVPGYSGSLGAQLRDTQKCKGRLLYYFPMGDAKGSDADVPEDGWIGWHNDSGFLTALAPDIYVDDATGEVIDNPDPSSAGLWVVDRDGGSVRVDIPRDCMAVQVGECVQIITGGELVATPHCVRGCRPTATGGRAVARVSCPVFVDSHPAFPLFAPPGVAREQVLARGVSSKVPPLGERWLQDGVAFGDFLGDSFRRYYEWSMSKTAPQAAA